VQPVDFVIVFATLVAVIVGLTGFFNLVLPMPYVPTSKDIAEKMVEVAEFTGNEITFDLGAGDGAILIAAARKHPGIRATGVEISPVVWLVGKLRILFSRQRVRFVLGNALKTDLREADVVFLYALPRFLELIRPKLDHELRPGTRVISHSFAFPEKQPSRTLQVPVGAHSHAVYRYDW
jgi:precorrin-6B methylase 2